MSTASLFVLAAAFTGTPDGVLLDFTAGYCSPCRQMNPIVSRLQREGFPIRKVDVEREPALVRRYKVTNIPCFLLIVHGQVVDQFVGATTESRLREMLAKIPARDDTAIAAAPAQPPATRAAAQDALPPLIRMAESARERDAQPKPMQEADQ